MKHQLRDFNSVASKWDQKPRRIQLASAVSEAIIKNAMPDQSMRALDFGAGTGLVTLALAPLIKEMVAADSSQGMLEQLQSKLTDSGITNVHPFLLGHAGPITLPGKFDLIVSSMTMHHISDIGTLLGVFQAAMNSGGQLCIADLALEDGSFHDDATGIYHNGFTAAEMEGYFSGAGLVNIRTIQVMTVKKEREGSIMEYPVNLTLGTA